MMVMLGAGLAYWGDSAGDDHGGVDDDDDDDDDGDDDGDDDDKHDDDHDDVFCMSMLLVLDAKSTSSSGCPLCHGGTSRARRYS